MLSLQLSPEFRVSKFRQKVEARDHLTIFRDMKDSLSLKWQWCNPPTFQPEQSGEVG